MVKKYKDIILRFIKGMFIGSGFILPGVSGGALAAIFGIYERLIGFLADIRKDFKNNLLFFLPVGLGAGFGIVLFSTGLSYLLERYETIILWFFIGAMVGTIPSLWKEAGKEGRNLIDYVILVLSFVFGLGILFLASSNINQGVEPNFFSWIFAGFLIALGMIVPGMSPSNFIVYMGMYKAMSDGFKNLDLAIILPIALGGIITLISLSKLINYIFKKYFSKLFHFILGVVLASTVIIIPLHQNFSIINFLMSFILFILGVGVSILMVKLEENYKK